MKIILDNIVYSLQKAGGISTYWGELSSRILRDFSDVTFIDRENENIISKKLKINKERVLKSRFTNLLIDRFMRINLKGINESFIFHSSYNRITINENAKQVLTVHDFVHEKYYFGIRRFLHSYQKSEAIKNANVIIVVSENTKKDLLHLYPQINPQKIRVIYNGVSDDFYPFKDKNISNYFLFIGSREKYKNFDFAVKAISQTARFSLNIVGSVLTKDEITMLNKFIPGRWQIFNNIDNITLNVLYNNAYALLYPSSYEGFGIPLLEAMRAGCPFIAYNSSSIPEIAGNAGVLIDKLEISQFNEAVLYIQENREKILNLGYNQVSKFSWENCYQETLNLYKELYKS